MKAKAYFNFRFLCVVFIFGTALLTFARCQAADPESVFWDPLTVVGTGSEAIYKVASFGVSLAVDQPDQFDCENTLNSLDHMNEMRMVVRVMAHVPAIATIELAKASFRLGMQENNISENFDPFISQFIDDLDYLGTKWDRLIPGTWMVVQGKRLAGPDQNLFKMRYTVAVKPETVSQSNTQYAVNREKDMDYSLVKGAFSVWLGKVSDIPYLGMGQIKSSLVETCRRMKEQGK